MGDPRLGTRAPRSAAIEEEQDRLRAGRKDRGRVALKYERAQDPAPVTPRVDANAVASPRNFWSNCVSVDHGEAVVGFVTKKISRDPP